MIPAADRVLTPAQYGAVAPSGADWPLNRRDYTRYRINRIYPTVQGEGSLCGTPMTIVRLQGCPVGCIFCDTPESWDQNFSSLSGGDEGRPIPAPDLSASQVGDVVNGHPPRWALVTGGEPLWHDCGALTSALHRHGIKTALETSGVYPISGVWDWVCVSPKPAGRLQIHPHVLAEANEVKWIVGSERDVVAYEVFLSRHAEHLRLTQDLRPRDARRPISLTVQPMSCSRRATELCLRALMDHPEWRLSLQTHKMLGVA